MYQDISFCAFNYCWMRKYEYTILCSYSSSRTTYYMYIENITNWNSAFTLFLNTYNCKSFFLLWVYKTPSVLFKTCLISSIACVVTTHFHFFSKCVSLGTAISKKKNSKCVDIVKLMLTHFENKNTQGLVVIIDSCLMQCLAQRDPMHAKLNW